MKLYIHMEMKGSNPYIYSLGAKLGGPSVVGMYLI
jgi:hypothetical protein